MKINYFKSYLIVLILFSLLSGIFVSARPAVASVSNVKIVNNIHLSPGYSTMTISGGNYTRWQTSTSVWSSASYQQQSINAAGGFGYFAGTSSNEWTIYSESLQFDMAPYLALPPGTEVISVQVRIKPNYLEENNSPVCSIPYVSVFDTNAGSDHTMDAFDMGNFVNNPSLRYRLSAPVYWNKFILNQYTDFTIPDNSITRCLTPASGDGNYKYLDIATEQHFLHFDPGTGGFWKSSEAYDCIFEDSAQLVITYSAVAAPPTMTYHTNDSIYVGANGSENVTAILLSTPSCMYADEPLEFDVQGQEGANCTLQLIDNAGKVLDSINDSVRIDGHYWWKISSLTSSYSGFVYCKDTHFNIYSPWVSVQPSVDASEANSMTYAAKTDYPQYDEPLSTYIVTRGSIMYIHWKTNIDMSSDNTDALKLDILLNGDAVNGVKYSRTFTDLNDNYFQGYSCNTSTHWRYAVFTPQATTGMNTYGGLIQDLNINAGAYNKGFLESMIYDTGDELTTCHSAYWYLINASEGPSMSLDIGTVKPSDPIGVTVKEPAACQAKIYLPNVVCKVVNMPQQGVGTFGISSPDSQDIIIDGIPIEGAYTVETVLSGGQCSYQYIYDLPLKISISESTAVPTTTGGSLDIMQMIDNILAKFHLNNTVGHWCLMIILMAIVMAVAVISKSRAVQIIACAICVLILGVGVIAGWVDVWIIILLSLFAGLFIWSLFRKKAAGEE